MLVLLMIFRGGTIIVGLKGVTYLWPIPPPLAEILNAIFVLCASMIIHLVGAFTVAVFLVFKEIEKASLQVQTRPMQETEAENEGIKESRKDKADGEL